MLVRMSKRTLVAALPLFCTFSSVVAQTPGPYTNQGCFSSSSGMTSSGSYMYQSPGYCSDQCKGQGKAVAATTKGKDCWCGDKLPPASSKTSDSSCNSPCTGYGQDSCGGSSTWSVYLTGLDDNPGSVSGSGSNSDSKSTSKSEEKSNSNSNADSDSELKADPKSSESESSGSSNKDSSDDSEPTSSTTSSSAPTPTPTPTTATTKTQKAKASVVTHARTIVVTAPGQSQAKTSVVITTQTSEPSEGDGGSGPNVAGIAAGVVVGVVAVAAIAGALFFFLRNRKRKALEEEYQRNAAANNFNTLKPATSSAGSTSDSRLEPSVMMQRRQSDGSIADNQDYSRRILKVTNY